MIIILVFVMEGMLISGIANLENSEGGIFREIWFGFKLI